ncbi:MAG: alanine racemase [Planctomycetes bacterium]|nr:alanine racemase [Planctomycetota bacterium]
MIEMALGQARRWVEQYGSPLYLVFETPIRERFRRLRRAFDGLGIQAAIAYSVKTNSLAGVCRILAEENAWADIVSGFEFEIACTAGFSSSRLVFNGPYKTEAELRALLGHARVNLENREQIERADAIGREKGIRLPVGLRIHILAGRRAWSRFGFSLESGEAAEAIALTRRLPGLDLAGLHTHIGTNLPDPAVFEKAARTLCDLAARLKAEGCSMQYLDLGGGFAAPGTPPRDWAGVWSVPPLEEFAAAVSRPVAEAFQPGERPLLVIEPGRALVAEAGILLSTVHSRRRTGGRLQAVLDAGVNLLPRACPLRHAVLNLSRPDGPKSVVDLWGPLCMPEDCVASGVEMSEPQAGDLLAIGSAGAYTFSLSTQFSRLRPSVLLVPPEGPPRLLRRSETPEDVLRLEMRD